jgi:hypothetical protein
MRASCLARFGRLHPPVEWYSTALLLPGISVDHWPAPEIKLSGAHCKINTYRAALLHQPMPAAIYS